MYVLVFTSAQRIRVGKTVELIVGAKTIKVFLWTTTLLAVVHVVESEAKVKAAQALKGKKK